MDFVPLKTNVNLLLRDGLPKQCEESIIVRIQVEDVYDNYNPITFDLEFNQGSVCKVDTENKNKPLVNWKVKKSRANDWEVNDEGSLMQGQVIGVIIIDCLSVYCKLVWPNFKKRTLENKLGKFMCCLWDHSEVSKRNLRTDLYLGHQILSMAGEKACNISYLCEESTETEKKTPFEKYIEREKNAEEESDEETTDESAETVGESKEGKTEIEPPLKKKKTSD